LTKRHVAWEKQIDDPDFNDLDALTKQIEKETLIFTKDVMTFLSENSN
jgi:hypothetical protein